MLSREDNETMCRVGRGTPMGEALRRYWVPILSSYQLPAGGGDPVKVEIFGERYVAFRDASGKVGLLDEQCAHRSASLSLGRVEGDGIRCLFHGWKFSATGAVLETPTVSEPRFRERFKARSFPVREAGAIVWAYVGPPELEPEFPHWSYFDYPAERLLSVTFVVPCNFVQVQESLLDSAHLTVLHRDAFRRKSDIEFAATVSTVTAAADPRIEVEDTWLPMRLQYASLAGRRCYPVAPGHAGHGGDDGGNLARHGRARTVAVVRPTPVPPQC